jgi:hypothetical protein
VPFLWQTVLNGGRPPEKSNIDCFTQTTTFAGSKINDRLDVPLRTVHLCSISLVAVVGMREDGSLMHLFFVCIRRKSAFFSPIIKKTEDNFQEFCVYTGMKHTKE